MVGEVYGDRMLATPRRRAIAAAAALVCVIAGVVVFVRYKSDAPFAACMGPTAERIDPNSSQHVLPGASEPLYLTNPPTSGPHKAGPSLPPVVETELDKPTQVGALEGGTVLLQYSGVASATRQRVIDLAKGHDVVVAPNSSLPNKIVATAWLFKLSCNEFSASDLRSFIDAHAGKAPAD